jgi:ATP adenylyltransferase/5',5'''-P-1,P-4-tetraphosphate phosphorylase II
VENGEKGWDIMTQEPLLKFNTAIARQKPNSVHQKTQVCPFCETDKLTGILDVKGPIILLENKYPVLQDAYPTLIIETNECESDLSEYSKAHLQDLMQFSVHHWLEMEKNKDFQSVIFYKNHGPLSGGTIRHPHMQIIGLKNVDYRESLKHEYFKGKPIFEKTQVELNLSTEPMIGFTEFNVIMSDRNLDGLPQFSNYIQMAVQFLLNDFYARVTSYNLFFYHWNNQLIAKIVPRFPTSPLFVGFRLRQVSNNIDGIISNFKARFGEF